MAATETAKQAIWLSDLLREIYGKECDKVVIRIDNKSAITLTKNPVFHKRNKHIQIRYHFRRECIEYGWMDVEHVVGSKQKTDILTKAFGIVEFKGMGNLIGFQDFVKWRFQV